MTGALPVRVRDPVDGDTELTDVTTGAIPDNASPIVFGCMY